MISTFLTDKITKKDIVDLSPQTESLNPPKPIPTANTKQSSQNNDAISLIKQLAELHSQGILTDEEFRSKKAVLLEKVGINPSDEEINEQIMIPEQETEENGWIIDGKSFVICPQCNDRMSIDFIKARGVCPNCGCEYYK